MSDIDVVVIGAGPAGLVAAAAAARAGRCTVLLEKNDRPGRKLLLTGNGRCNLVDPARPALDALDAYGRAGRFLRDALAGFDFAAFLAGLDVTVERDATDGRCTVSGGARRMCDALVCAAEAAGVQVVTGTKVTGLAASASGGFDVSVHGRGVTHASRVVVATGGFTWRETGSTGDAYAWAEALGHAIDAPRGALGALATEPHFTALAGSSVPDAGIVLRIDGRRAGRARGAVLFTHRGVSGPAIMDLSMALAAARSDADAEIDLDLVPEVERTALERWIAGRRRRRSDHLFRDARIGRGLSGRLVRDLLVRADIAPARDLSQVPRSKLRALAAALKATHLAVTGFEDPDACIVTLGGVATRDVDAKTMQSQLVGGLFFAGEILSPAGLCGGYNLLACFATGTLAGDSVR